MLLILFIILLAVIAWIVLKPAWLPKPPKNQVTSAIVKGADAVTKGAGTFSAQSKGWVQRIDQRWRKPAKSGKEFIAWARQADLAGKLALSQRLPEEAAGLAGWLASLSNEELGHLADELAGFCYRQNLELAWLFNAKAEPELKAALEEIITFWLMGFWQGHRLQPLASFQAWQDAPHAKGNRAFTQQVYTRLVAAGLASAPSELLFAADKEREEHVVKAIQAADAENHAVVLALVGELFTAQAAEYAAKPKASGKTKKQAKSAAAAPDGKQTAAV
jgi:hypothetical protein